MTPDQHQSAHSLTGDGLSAHGRAVLEGMDRADSIVMDPHKGLGLPYGTGAVLVRDRRLLAKAFHYYADYMQDAIPAERSTFSVAPPKMNSRSRLCPYPPITRQCAPLVAAFSSSA